MAVIRDEFPGLEAGDHGGADPVMLGYLSTSSINPTAMPAPRRTAKAPGLVLTGIAANEAIATGTAIDIDALLARAGIELGRSGDARLGRRSLSRQQEGKPYCASWRNGAEQGTATSRRQFAPQYVLVARLARIHCSGSSCGRCREILADPVVPHEAVEGHALAGQRAGIVHSFPSKSTSRSRSRYLGVDELDLRQFVRGHRREHPFTSGQVASMRATSLSTMLHWTCRPWTLSAARRHCRCIPRSWSSPRSSP